MGFISRNWRIVAASAGSMLMIAAAFVLAQGAGTPIAQAATESELLTQIANRDSTGDGLPDWEKPLYGIPLDATTTDYFHLGMTDGAAAAQGLIVPKAIAEVAPAPAATPAGLAGAPQGTVTAAFAQQFFVSYLQAKQAAGGAALSTAQINQLAQQSLDQLSQSIAPAPDFRTATDLNLSGAGSEALTTFAAQAQNVFAAHDVNLPKSELDYLQDALNGDTTATLKISALSSYYRNSALGIAALPVPKEAAAADLALINALARMGQATGDLSRISTDPVSTMLALKQYPIALTALVNAFASIQRVYAAAGVSIPRSQPGGFFVNEASNFATSSTP